MKLHLVTYGDGFTRKGRPFARNATDLRDAALAVGFDHATTYTRDDLKGTVFEAENAALLQEKRGGGYWVWKPYVIRKALERIDDGDVLIYSDAGKLPPGKGVCRPDLFAELALSMPEGFLSGIQLRNRRHDRWTKRDCFVLMDADHPDIRAASQLQVGWSAWTKSPQSFALLEKWQHYNRDRRVVSDDDNVMGLPNYRGFKENRHDQSIYTNAMFQLNLPFLMFNAAPARGLVEQAYAQENTNLRKFWGGERILELLKAHFEAQGASDPMEAIRQSVVRRFRDL